MNEDEKKPADNTPEGKQAQPPKQSGPDDFAGKVNRAYAPRGGAVERLEQLYQQGNRISGIASQFPLPTPPKNERGGI